MNKSIQKMFEPLAGRYELVNHVITFGQDTLWRKKAAGIAAEPSRAAGAVAGSRGAPGQAAVCPGPATVSSGRSARSLVWLDVSTGTGEMAHLLSREAGPSTSVLATDFSLPMLRVAARKRTTRKKAARERSRHRDTGRGRNTSAAEILLVAADDQQLPFRDASLDLVTISLGTRNLNTSRSALVSSFREFHRVLRPGGRFVNLETSQPRSRAIRTLFHGYARRVLRPVATALSGNSSAYLYLAGTMCSFYRAEELAAIIREAGFARVEATALFLGVAAIHVAEKSTGEQEGG